MHKRIRHRPIRLYPYALNLPLWSFPLVGPSPTPLAPHLSMPNPHKPERKLQPRKIYLVPMTDKSKVPTPERGPGGQAVAPTVDGYH